MKPRYTKPQARDLGGYRSMLASGQWDGPPMPGMPGGSGPQGDEMNVCWQGSSANPHPGCLAGGDVTALADCVPGGTASGAGCGRGQQPGTNACNSGGNPQYWGCTYGLAATAPCASGLEVV